MNGLTNGLDSGSLRVVVYVVVAAVALVWGERERRSTAVERVDWWPPYWYTSALVLVSMALARAGSVGDLIGEIGRDQALETGWYDARRAIQAGLVVAVTVAWAIGVIVAVWRVPPRRRRYLPHAVALSAVIAFAAIRIVSLHQVDALLYRRDIAGVRIVAWTELILLAATALSGVLVARFPSRAAAPDEPRAVTVDAGRGSGAAT